MNKTRQGPEVCGKESINTPQEEGTGKHPRTATWSSALLPLPIPPAAHALERCCCEGYRRWGSMMHFSAIPLVIPLPALVRVTPTSTLLDLWGNLTF